MNQRGGYALAFALVLLLACAGAFFGGRFLWNQIRQTATGQTAWVPPEQRTPTLEAGGAQAPTADPAAAKPQPTATRRMVLTPFVPMITVVEPTQVPVPTDLPETPTPEVVMTATETITPTAVIAGVTNSYVLASAVRNSSGDCSGNLILGQVTDRTGKALANVRLQLTDEYGAVSEIKVSKSSGADLGRYDFPLFGPGRHYFVQVIDANGRPISQRIDVAHLVGNDPKASCHWVNWTQP